MADSSRRLFSRRIAGDPATPACSRSQEPYVGLESPSGWPVLDAHDPSSELTSNRLSSPFSASSRHRCGRRVRSEYGADLEISSSTIVSRVLLGSTVDQVSAVSPALNLMWSMHMVLTMARRRRRSANAAFLFGLCAIFGGRGCVGWVVIGHESDTG